jgi:hypothetical protein
MQRYEMLQMPYLAMVFPDQFDIAIPIINMDCIEPTLRQIVPNKPIKIIRSARKQGAQTDSLPKLYILACC